MVLAHYGIEASEDDLRFRSYTTLWGTNARDAVACARSFGLQARVIREATTDNLREWLDRGLFPILLIDLRPIHGELGRHSVVAEAISGTYLTYLDPLTGHQASELDLVEQAWQLNHCRAILISPLRPEIE